MKSKIQRVTSSVVRVLLVVLLLLMTLLFAIIQGGFVLWFVFFIIVPFAIHSIFVFFIPLQKMKIHREIVGDRLVQGEPLRIRMTLERNTRIPGFFLLVQEMNATGMFNEMAVNKMKRLLPIGFKRKIHWEYSVAQLVRGKHELIGVQVDVSDLLGWVRKTEYLKAPRNIIVYPKIEEMKFSSSLSQEQGQFGQTNRKQRHHSTMVASVRDYAPGDRMTWIHWQSFAKTGELYTKEFEYQQSENACVILDTAKGADFEAQISLAASLMNAAFRQKEQVGFLGAGKHRFALESLSSEKEIEKLMYYLATIQPTNYAVRGLYERDELLESAFALILITSNLQAEWIDLLAKNANRGSEPIIYLVRPKNYRPFAEDLAMARHAESKGIRLIITEENKFSSLNKGEQR